VMQLLKTTLPTSLVTKGEKQACRLPTVGFLHACICTHVMLLLLRGVTVAAPQASVGNPPHELCCVLCWLRAVYCGGVPGLFASYVSKSVSP